MPDKPKRTPGQLIAVPHTEHPDHKKLSIEIAHVEEGKGPTIAETVGIDVGDAIAEANAAHIVECWNAMEGIGSPRGAGHGGGMNLGKAAINHIVKTGHCENARSANPGTFYCAGLWPNYTIPWCIWCLCLRSQEAARKTMVPSPGR